MLNRSQFKPFGTLVMSIGAVFLVAAVYMIGHAIANPIEPGRFGLPHVLFTVGGMVAPVGLGMIALGIWARRRPLQ